MAAKKKDTALKITSVMHFAQQLAANEEKIRNKAVQKLRRWLSSHSNTINDFTEEEFMKLWKGLFYCMWMSDKPIIQEDLADKMSKLMHCFGREDYPYLFIDAFFKTMAREWWGIDKYRLEKFMMLIRRVLRASFEVVKKQGWKIQPIKNLRKVLVKTVLSPNSDKTPLGLKIHVIDMYLDELARVGRHEINSKQALRFLVPYCRILATTDNMYLLSTVIKCVFHYIMYQSEVCMGEETNNDEVSEKEEEERETLRIEKPNVKRKENNLESYQELPVIDFDYTAVGDLLMKYASSEKVRRKNRIKLYKLIKQFRDVAQGVDPFDKFNPIPLGPKIGKKDIQTAAKRLLEEDLEFQQETLEWKKKLKKKKVSK